MTKKTHDLHLVLKYMKATLSQISRFIYLPDFRITSAFRTDSNRHKEFSAIDIVFQYPEELNQYKTDVIFAKYFNKMWNGGLGVNFADCRHFHIDLKPTRSRWLEKSKNTSGSCKGRLIVEKFPSLGDFNKNDQDFLRKHFFQRDPLVTLNNEKRKLSQWIGEIPSEPKNEFFSSPGLPIILGIAALLYFKDR